MSTKRLILVTSVPLLFCSHLLFGQETPASLQSKNIKEVIVKADKKTYHMEMNSVSKTDSAFVSTLKPEWIDSMTILKDKSLHGGDTTSTLIINLKRKALGKLPAEIRNSFQ